MPGTLEAPYIVSFDVSRAYDNVDVAQLLQLVEPLLQQPNYLMVKYAEVRLGMSPDDPSQSPGFRVARIAPQCHQNNLLLPPCFLYSYGGLRCVLASPSH